MLKQNNHNITNTHISLQILRKIAVVILSISLTFEFPNRFHRLIRRLVRGFEKSKNLTQNTFCNKIRRSRGVKSLPGSSLSASSSGISGKSKNRYKHFTSVEGTEALVIVWMSEELPGMGQSVTILN